ncbi:hypothetical protein ACTMU2_27290 [Cupriavidus basilensis]
MAVTYYVAIAVFGGFAQLFSTLLIHMTGRSERARVLPDRLRPGLAAGAGDGARDAGSEAFMTAQQAALAMSRRALVAGVITVQGSISRITPAPRITCR